MQTVECMCVAVLGWPGAFVCPGESGGHGLDPSVCGLFLTRVARWRCNCRSQAHLLSWDAVWPDGFCAYFRRTPPWPRSRSSSGRTWPLIYTLNPALAAYMPAYWAPIPTSVAQAILDSPTGQVPYSDFRAAFPSS